MATTPSAENITILCGLATLSFLTDVNEWSTENEPKYYRVNAGQVNSIFRYLEDNGTVEWLTATVKTGANRAKHVANLKKGGAIGAVMDKTHAIRSLLDSFVTKKNPSLAGVRADVRNWTGWSRAFVTILDEEDFDHKSMAVLMRAFRALKPNVTSPDGRKMFSTLVREPLMNAKGDVHKESPEEDPDDAPAPEPTPKPEPEKPKAPEPSKSKTTEPARTRVVQKDGGWTIMNGSDTLGWKQLATVKDRSSAVAFLKGMGMNSVTADALASVIPDKKTEPETKSKTKKSEAPSGTPLTPEKIQKTYGLDPNQSKVVAADAEEQVVSAAAGSGKTSTTVRKIEYLVNQLGVEPSSIKVMAFNKHAAREVKSRLAQNIGLEKANQVYPQTTHGFCLSEMKAWSPFHKEGCGALVTGSSMPWDGKYLTPGPMLVRQAWEESLKRLGYMTKRGDGGWKRPRKDDIGVDIGTLKRWIGKSKNEGMTLTDFMASEWERREDQRVQILMAGLLLYEEQKGMLDREKERGDSRTEEYVDYFLPPAGSGDAESGDWDTKLRKALGRLEGNEGVSVRFDFDDMLNEFYLGITELPTDNDRAKAAKRERVEKLRDDFKYWMVDEAQDLAPVQHKIFNTVARGRDGDGQYILIGDPDQSIYGFRGATPESFVDAEKTSESMSIPINYRSRKEIVELADKLVGENKLRIARANVANRPAGGTVKAYSLKDYESISTYVAGDIVGKLGSGGYLNERGTPRFSIICRTNKELDMFEDELAIRGITYVRRGGRPFWLKDDVGATTALMALAYHISGKMKLEPKEQLEYLGRAFKFPNRPGAPGASSGQSGKFYLKPVANSNDPIGTLLSVSAGDISGRPGTGDAVVAFAKDIKSVAAAVKDGPTGMFRAMLGMESKGYDGQTFGDLMIEASVRSEDDSELQDTAGEAGGDDPVEGVSAFSKLFRFYEYNKFTSPEQFVQACVESTNRSAVMQAKVIAKKDDANLEAVNLSTIHMTKGLEYENVYTVMNQGKFPSNVFPTDDLLANRDRLAKYDGGDNEEKLKNMKLEEERRLAYVAITRATESFTAFASETDLKGQPAEKSQFLSEMGLTPETIEVDESVKAAVDSHMADVLRSL